MWAIFKNRLVISLRALQFSAIAAFLKMARAAIAPLALATKPNTLPARHIYW